MTARILTREEFNSAVEDRQRCLRAGIQGKDYAEWTEGSTERLLSYMQAVEGYVLQRIESPERNLALA